MSGNDIFGFAVACLLGVLCIILSLFLLAGRDPLLLIGIDLMPNGKRERYDDKALCKFKGKALFPIGLLIPLIALGYIYNITWIMITCFALVVGIFLFGSIYSSTGDRFRK